MITALLMLVGLIATPAPRTPKPVTVIDCIEFIGTQHVVKEGHWKRITVDAPAREYLEPIVCIELRCYPISDSQTTLTYVAPSMFRSVTYYLTASR